MIRKRHELPRDEARRLLAAAMPIESKTRATLLRGEEPRSGSVSIGSAIRAIQTAHGEREGFVVIKRMDPKAVAELVERIADASQNKMERYSGRIWDAIRLFVPIVVKALDLEALPSISEQIAEQERLSVEQVSRILALARSPDGKTA